MEVNINSSNEVTIDGVKAGNLADAFLNNRDAAGAIYDALVAYEESLRAAGRESTAAVQELLDTANARVLELETQATADNEAHATALREAQANFDSQLAAAATEFSDALTTARSEFATNLQAAQASTASANDRAKIAESCQKAHWDLVTILMAAGTSEAAVAAVQEINRINAAREKAELLAKVAALPPE